VTEAGAEWIATRDKRILALCKELGITTFPTHTRGKKIFFDGKAHPFSGLGLPIGILGVVEAVATIAELELMADTVPLEAPEKAKNAAEWDSMTVATWLDGHVTSSTARALLDVAVGGPVGGTAQGSSLLHYLFIAKSNGSPLEMISVKGGALELRVNGGTGLIVERLAAKVGRDHTILSSPVRRIEQSGSSVRVVADGGSYVAKHAIVAVAPPMTAQIDYDPPLPSPRAQFAQHAPMGWLLKCFAVYPKPFWRDAGYVGIVNSIVPPLSGVFDNSPEDGSLGCLFGLIAGDDARISSQKSAAERRAAVLDVFTKCFGSQAARPTKYLEQDWAAEPWIRGGASIVLPPGVLTEFPGVIRKPIGRIHWASTETAIEAYGDMEGAIIQGERAAAEALA